MKLIFPAYYQDLDGDGLGEPETKVISCEPLEGYLTTVDNDAIAELEIKGLTIFPNPASSNIFLSLNATSIEKVQIEIFDLTGKSIFQKLQNLNNGANKIRINIEEFAPSIYFIKIIDEDKHQTVKKFIKS